MKPDGKNLNKSKFNERRNENKKVKVKKPFDKKTYRLKKYSNKYKVEQWEEKKKKAVLRGFYKDLERENKNTSHDNPSKNSEDTAPKKKPNAFFQAKLEYQRKLEEKKRKKEEILRAKEEKEEALKKYKEKRTENYKKLSKKTKKGQPVMKDRLEMLLEKIQQTT